MLHFLVHPLVYSVFTSASVKIKASSESVSMYIGESLVLYQCESTGTHAAVSRHQSWKLGRLKNCQTSNKFPDLVSSFFLFFCDQNLSNCTQLLVVYSGPGLTSFPVSHSLLLALPYNFSISIFPQNVDPEITGCL